MSDQHAVTESVAHHPAFAESDVTFTSGDGATRLAGTLVAPHGVPDAPAVVLVSGTGPLNRDVTFVGHKLFRVLAHRLADAGIASLRFDKRGVGGSGGDFALAGLAEFTADVVGARGFLADGAGFSPGRTGLLGHSEGGVVSMTAASRIRDLPFCVMLASPMLSGKENLIRSLALIARGHVCRDAEFERYVADIRTIVDAARAPAGIGPAAEVVEIADSLAPRIFNARTAVVFGTESLSGAEFIALLSSPCLATCLEWEPAAVLRLVSCPVLVVYAEKDVQAPALENRRAAEGLLASWHSHDHAVREVAGMNHAFQRCDTGMPDEYAAIDHVMAEEVVDGVAAWVVSSVRGAGTNAHG